MTSVQTFVVQILSTLAILVPAVLGAIKAWRSSGNTDDLKNSTDEQNIRLLRLEQWQAEQDKKLGAIREDQARGFQDAGKARAEMDKQVAVLHTHVEAMQRRVERIPTHTQSGYVRQQVDVMEHTPLPSLPPIKPVGEE